MRASRPSHLDPQSLAAHTHARVALGRAGNALPTQALLRFQADHATAKQAVQTPFDATGLQHACAALGLPWTPVQTEARSQDEYLHNPLAGRVLTDSSQRELRDLRDEGAPPDIVFVVSGGLSPQGVNVSAGDLLALAVAGLRESGLRVGPVVVADRARVGVINGIGEALGVRSIAILIGERPGLTVPDSMGVYFEYRPRTGLTDADRNCISNIHAGGLSLPAAAQQLRALIVAGLAQRTSGVDLQPPVVDRAVANGNV